MRRVRLRSIPPVNRRPIRPISHFALSRISSMRASDRAFHCVRSIDWGSEDEGHGFAPRVIRPDLPTRQVLIELRQALARNVIWLGEQVASAVNEEEREYWRERAEKEMCDDSNED